MWEETEGKANYLVVACGTHGAVLCGGKLKEKVAKWHNAWKERWGNRKYIATFTSSSYLAPYILKDAIERAGTLETEEVIKALEETDMKGTIQGRIRFDKYHDTIQSTDSDKGVLGVWFQWQDGKRVELWPPEFATGEFKLPPWMKR